MDYALFVLLVFIQPLYSCFSKAMQGHTSHMVIGLLFKISDKYPCLFLEVPYPRKQKCEANVPLITFTELFEIKLTLMKLKLPYLLFQSSMVVSGDCS